MRAIRVRVPVLVAYDGHPCAALETSLTYIVPLPGDMLSVDPVRHGATRRRRQPCPAL